MIDDKYESISCLMDGHTPEASEHAEFDTQTTLSLLKNDAESRARWSRYHLIGACLRDEVSVGANINIADRVMAALENEPTVIAPHAMSLPKKITRKLFKPLVGAAIAASAAFVTLVSVQLMQQQNLSDSNATWYADAASATDIKTLLSVNKNITTPPVLSTVEDEYLMDHMAHSAAGRMQGVSPYVRLAGYESQ
ncbi:MAG: sigma-E factor negative regulatory protein [Gammaproteobacteria bacterium]|nr:sigma-E factor negative regulatory protein [Gammaproteobacteria bacterium]